MTIPTHGACCHPFEFFGLKEAKVCVPKKDWDKQKGDDRVVHRCGLTIGVNRRYRSGAVVGDEESERLAGNVTRRGSVRVERWVRQLCTAQLENVERSLLRIDTYLKMSGKLLWRHLAEAPPD